MTLLDHQRWLIDHYQQLFDDIANIPKKMSIHRQVCYISLLDGLAKYCYPTQGNRERFCNFLKNIANWSDSDKVSLIQLKYYTIEKGLTCFDFLNVFIFPEACEDIRVSIFDKLIDTSTMDKSQKKIIESFKHSSLLYKFRCGLVHELVQLSIPYPLDLDEPFYVACFDHEGQYGTTEHTWNLHYPEIFLKELCQAGITNTLSYFIAGNIDPYHNYKLITHWN